MTSEQIVKSLGILALFLPAVFLPAVAATAQQPTNNSVSVTKTIVDRKSLTFAVGQAAKFSTTVNGRSHQQSPITTYRGYQYAAYYDARRHVCIGRRKLLEGDWDVIRFTDHKIKTNDAHNTVVIGICHIDGTIHVAFDHHATQLNYRVSQLGIANYPNKVKWESKLFGKIQHSLGSITRETRVTYPRFFNAANGNLMLYYRGGTSGNGNGCIEEFNGTKHRWTDGLGPFISRKLGSFEANGIVSQYRCPYMNDLTYAGNRLHASWVWRDRFEKTKASNQHDLCYAFSDDNGRTWQNSNGETIGTTNSELIGLNLVGLVVATIPVRKGLTNQNTQYAYTDGSIHIVVGQHSKENRGRSYQHYWRNATGKWNTETLPFYGQRPKIVGDKHRNLLIVFNEGDEYLRIAKGTPNVDHSAWKWEKIKLQTQISVSGEPLVDLARWRLEKVLSIYCQQKPKKVIRTILTSPVNGFPTPLLVLDVRVSSKE